jgi:hypothetical protein
MTSVSDTPGAKGTPSNRRRGATPPSPEAESPASTETDETASTAGRRSRRLLGYRRQRFEARKVRRLIRHVDPWSVLKLSLLLALCMWVIGMIAAVIVWSVAHNTGALASLEKFINENLQLEDWTLDGEVLFRQFGLISLLCALGFAAATVVASLVFNLISDIIGGVWVSVIEEETARPISVDGGSRH